MEGVSEAVAVFSLAKKTYSSQQYIVAAALAFAFGAMYTIGLFHPILGPGLLLMGGLFLVKGVQLRRDERARASPAPAAGSGLVAPAAGPK